MPSITSEVNQLWGSSFFSNICKFDLVDFDFFQIDKKNMRKLLASTFQQCFRHFNTLNLHKCSDLGLFRHLINDALCSLYFGNKSVRRVIFFSKMFKIGCRFQKWKEKMKKISWILKKITFELISLNTHFYRERIFVNWRQYVKNQS